MQRLQVGRIADARRLMAQRSVSGAIYRARRRQLGNRPNRLQQYAQPLQVPDGVARADFNRAQPPREDEVLEAVVRVVAQCANRERRRHAIRLPKIASACVGAARRKQDQQRQEVRQVRVHDVATLSRRADVDMQSCRVGGRVQIKQMPHRNQVSVACCVRQRGAMGAQFAQQRIDGGVRARGNLHAAHEALARVAPPREVARRVLVVIARVTPQQFRQRVEGVQRRARRRRDKTSSSSPSVTHGAA
jgi:hypothetical protein